MKWVSIAIFLAACHGIAEAPATSDQPASPPAECWMTAGAVCIVATSEYRLIREERSESSLRLIYSGRNWRAPMGLSVDPRCRATADDEWLLVSQAREASNTLFESEEFVLRLSESGCVVRLQIPLSGQDPLDWARSSAANIRTCSRDQCPDRAIGAVITHLLFPRLP